MRKSRNPKNYSQQIMSVQNSRSSTSKIDGLTTFYYMYIFLRTKREKKGEKEKWESRALKQEKNEIMDGILA